MHVIISELAFLEQVFLFSLLRLNLEMMKTVPQKVNVLLFCLLQLAENENLSIKTILPADIYTLDYIFLRLK